MNYNIISIYKPDETQIANIEVLKPTRIKKYSGCNEYKFSIPELTKDTETDHQIDNPDIQFVQYHYLTYIDNHWYIIEKIDKRVENKVKYIDVTCFGRAYQLNQYKCKVQTGIVQGSTVINAKNLSDTAQLVLQNTNYSLGTVSTSLDLKIRAVDINSKCLSALDTLCEYWDCIWQETPDKKINFVDYKNGIFKGGYLTAENFIKSLSLDMKESSIITRLHIFGKDGISVHSVNFGRDYVDDFSFFKNLTYMSQSMIDNLNSYETAISNAQSQYNIYLNELSTFQSTLNTKQNDLKVLTDSAIQKQIQIDVASADKNDALANTRKTELATIQNNISIKNSEITSVQSQITAKNGQITTLSNSLLITNFLTTDQIKLLNEYIIEEDFNDTVITSKGTTDVELKELLEAGKEYLRRNNCPRVDVSVDLLGITFLNDRESKLTVESLELGSIAKIYVKKIDVNIDVRIISIEESFDDCKVTVTLSNQKDIQDPSFKVKELLTSASESRDLIALNIDNWMLGKEANSAINEYMSNNINTISQSITNSTNSYELNDRGLVFRDITNPQYMSVYSSNGLLLSENSGSSWNVAIGKGQVWGEIIGGKIIVGNQGKFNKLEIYNPSTNVLDCEIGNYTSSIDGSAKRGIKLTNSALEIVGGIQESQLSPSVANAYVKLGQSYNNVVIDSSSGINVIRSDNKVKTIINATDGFKIMTGSNGNFNTTMFSVDTNGQGYFGGIVNAKDFQINGTSILTTNGLIKGSSISADSLYVNSANITGTITADTVKSNWIYSGVINAQQIYGGIANLSESVNIGDIYSNEEKTLNFYNSGSTSLCNIKLDINGNMFVNSYQGLYLGNGGGYALQIQSQTVTFNGTVYGIESSSWTQPNHNHGISGGTRLAICDITGKIVGSVVWSESGGFTHYHSIY